MKRYSKLFAALVIGLVVVGGLGGGVDIVDATTEDLDSCTTINREFDGTAACTDCLDGYEEDDVGSCELTEEPTESECTTSNRVYDSTDLTCGGCESGFEENDAGDCEETDTTTSSSTVSTSTSTTTTSTSATHALTNPLGSTDLRVVIGYIIKALLGLSGAIALFVFVWSGIMMMLAAGSPEKIKTAKASLTWATIGLVVIFTAYTLVYTLITALSTGT